MLVDAAEPVGVETDPVDGEAAEERRAREAAKAARSELVTRAVDVQLFPPNFAFRVGHSMMPTAKAPRPNSLVSKTSRAGEPSDRDT